MSWNSTIILFWTLLFVLSKRTISSSSSLPSPTTTTTTTDTTPVETLAPIELLLKVASKEADDDTYKLDEDDDDDEEEETTTLHYDDDEYYYDYINNQKQHWTTSSFHDINLDVPSSTCFNSLKTFFTNPALLAVATEASSHPSGLISVFAQPWLYAGGGLGNIDECPDTLQVCIAGAGTRRDSITFASLCIPKECKAYDLTSHHFTKAIHLAAAEAIQVIAAQEGIPGLLPAVPTPPQQPITNSTATTESDMQPELQQEQNELLMRKQELIERLIDKEKKQILDLIHEYLILNERIHELNKFLNTGWTCGEYVVPFRAFPYGLPYIVFIIGLTCIIIYATYCVNNKIIKLLLRQLKAFRTPVFGWISSSSSSSFEQISRHSRRQNRQRIPNSPGREEEEEENAAEMTTIIDNNNDTDTNMVTDSSISSSSSSDTNSSSSGCNNNRYCGSVLDTNPNSTTTPAWYTFFDCHQYWNQLYASRKSNTTSTNTEVLDVLKTISILWVVLGHVMAIQSDNGGGYSNPIDFLPPYGLTTTFLGQILFASRFAVDTFFVISGYLLVHILFQRKEKENTSTANSKKKNYKSIGNFQLLSMQQIPFVLFYRILRILPLYGICLGFYTQIAPHTRGVFTALFEESSNNVGLGFDNYGHRKPFWYQWESLLKPCRDYGWTNFLFINNFYPFNLSSTDTCFYHSWYLAVDMQLFLLGILILSICSYTYLYFVKSPTTTKFQTTKEKEVLRLSSLSNNEEPTTTTTTTTTTMTMTTLSYLRHTLFVITILWLLSLFVTMYLSYIREWSINTFDGADVARFDVEAYAKPHVRAQGYLAGMFVGLLCQYRKQQLRCQDQQQQQNQDRTILQKQQQKQQQPYDDLQTQELNTNGNHYYYFTNNHCVEKETAPSMTRKTNWKHHVSMIFAISMLGIITFVTVTGAYSRRPCRYIESPLHADCGSTWSPIYTWLYTSTSRALWSISISIIIYLCIQGHYSCNKNIDDNNINSTDNTIIRRSCVNHENDDDDDNTTGITYTGSSGYDSNSSRCRKFNNNQIGNDGNANNNSNSRGGGRGSSSSGRSVSGLSMFWTISSQLSYCVYLIHPIVIFVWMLGENQKQVFDIMSFFMTYISVCAVSYFFAFILVMTIEFPFAAFFKHYIINRGDNVKSNTDSSNNSRNDNEIHGNNDGDETHRSTTEISLLIPQDGHCRNYNTTKSNVGADTLIGGKQV